MYDGLFNNPPINLDQLPPAESPDFMPIEKGYAKVLYVSNGIFFFLLLVVILVLIFVEFGIFYWPSYALLIAWFVCTLGFFWFLSISVRYKSYALRDKDISYKSGVWFTSWITIPFNRVQHCELSKGVVERAIGLAELRIFTAGGSSSDITIPGLDPDTAHRVKEHIINKIKDQDEEE